MDRRVKPVCRDCGRPHWNIVPCQKAREQDARSERDLRLRVEQYHGFTAGGRTVGDSLHTLQRVGENRFVRVRDDDGPQAA